MFFLRFLQEHILANRGVHLDHILCKFLSKKCCLNKVIFPVAVVKILRYIQQVFSFRVQPVRTMTITTIQLLSRLFCQMALTICFDRFDWSLAIGYLVSTNMASLLWTHQAEKFNTSNVILCQAELSNFCYKLLMLTEIIKWNDMVNSAYCFTQAFHSHGISQEFVKKWTGKLFQIPCFCGGFT